MIYAVFSNCSLTYLGTISTSEITLANARLCLFVEVASVDALWKYSFEKNSKLLSTYLHFLTGLIIGNVLTDCWIVADADVKGSIIEQFTMLARVIARAAIAFEIGTIIDE